MHVALVSKSMLQLAKTSFYREHEISFLNWDLHM